MFLFKFRPQALRYTSVTTGRLTDLHLLLVFVVACLHIVGLLLLFYYFLFYLFQTHS